MKHLIILFFLVCLVTSFCSAQSPIDLTGKLPKPVSKIGTIAVTFISNDTCNLVIDGNDYGKIVNDKTIKLQLGNYKLIFESLETGKTIKDRAFRLTKDKVKGGTYSYPVTFK